MERAKASSLFPKMLTTTMNGTERNARKEKNFLHSETFSFMSLSWCKKFTNKAEHGHNIHENCFQLPRSSYITNAFESLFCWKWKLKKNLTRFLFFFMRNFKWKMTPQLSGEFLKIWTFFCEFRNFTWVLKNFHKY